jgi:signal transduction histidine kinase/purine-cytosine permease-like protein
MALKSVRPRRSYQAWVANETIEDYSLRYAAASFRKWSPFVIANTALGGISFLALEAIGGAITISYGFANAFPAIVVVSLLIFITSLPIAYYSSRYNIDMDLLTRGAGFGYIGSTITSLIYACFTFIFFALEAAIMAQALFLYAGLPIVLGYILSSIVIIPIVFLGATLISKLQIVTQPVWLLLLVTPFVLILVKEPEVLGQWVVFAGNRAGADAFNYLYFGAATGVLFALVVQIGEQVDYLRFMPDRTRANRLRWWAAVIGSGPGWILLGGLKILAGSLLAVLVVAHGQSAEQAVEPIHMYVTAYEFVSSDPLIMLTAATVFVLISQIKINVTNAYAGSLAWSNFYSRVTHYHPGRVVWLIFNILISLLLMLLGIFETLEAVLAVYSIVAIAWIGAIFADLAVLKPIGISPSFIEFRRAHLHDFNPVGCGAMAISSVLAIAAYGGLLGRTAEAYAAMLSLGTAFVAAITIGIVTRGRYYLARKDGLATMVEPAATIACTICAYRYERQDMAYCPFYDGAICSLCCSLDAHCHDVCKRPASLGEVVSEAPAAGLARRLLPPAIGQRLAKFFGVVLVLAIVVAALFLLAYRMAELDQGFVLGDSAHLLLRLYLAALVLICVAAWWIVLAQESRELAERELISSLEQLGETRQELMQAERFAAIGQLTATVSHELRNPLGTLVSSISIIKRSLAGLDGKVGRELAKMDRSIRRCVAIIDELTEFSRERKVYARPIPIDRWLAAELAEWHPPQTVALRDDLAAGTATMIDPERFRQVLVNLLQNAQQAILGEAEDSPGAGVITVATRRLGDAVELTVTDTGPGLPIGARDKIFSPLFSTKAFGVGLGLPLVKRIVEAHRGSIAVDSEIGAGTVVRIRLPACVQELPDAG